MKRTALFAMPLLAILFSVVLFLPACGDDDDKPSDQEMIVGNWTLQGNDGLATDNANLTNALTELMLNSGINPAAMLFSFDATKQFEAGISNEGATISLYKTEYKLEKGKLAIVLDDVIPAELLAMLPEGVSFDTSFNVVTLNDTQLVIEKSFSPVLLSTLVAIIESQSPESAAMIKGILGDSITKGLKITIKLQKQVALK